MNQFCTVKITTSGKNPINFLHDIPTRFYPEMQSRLVELAEMTVNRMREIISSSKKRPSMGSNLEDTITSEILDSTGGIGIGIGNITYLKSKAPYFEVLNEGGYVPYSTVGGAPLGSFYGDRPVVGGSGQNWERSGEKGFFMKPKKPIEGIHYIEIAGKELTQKIEIETKTWINNELKGLSA